MKCGGLGRQHLGSHLVEAGALGGGARALLGAGLGLHPAAGVPRHQRGARGGPGAPGAPADQNEHQHQHVFLIKQSIHKLPNNFF